MGQHLRARYGVSYLPIGFAFDRGSFQATAVTMDHGHPVIELAPRDPLSRSLREMAASLAPVAASAGGWWQRLIRRAA